VSLGERLALGLVGLAVGIIGVILILGSDGDLLDRDREAPSLAGATSAAAQVTFVVDGDTVVIGSGAHVRLIGIDTPEKGVCGNELATEALQDLVQGRKVTLVNPASVQDKDKYERLLRYVDLAGRDAGHDLLRRGLAVARYDSRDGYDHHPRQAKYRSADRAVSSVCD
jgi:endonuclease YncB( thermonuclease family)